MFSLRVDDEITLVLAEERHARVMTDLIVRNQARLARWEPWAEQPATLEGTRAYIRAALDDFVRGRQISTIIAVDGGTVGGPVRFVSADEARNTITVIAGRKYESRIYCTCSSLRG